MRKTIAVRPTTEYGWHAATTFIYLAAIHRRIGNREQVLLVKTIKEVVIAEIAIMAHVGSRAMVISRIGQGKTAIRLTTHVVNAEEGFTAVETSPTHGSQGSLHIVVPRTHYYWEDVIMKAFQLVCGTLADFVYLQSKRQCCCELLW